MQNPLVDLYKGLDDCLIRDRHPLRQKLRRLSRDLEQGRDISRERRRLEQRLQRSAAIVAARRDALPAVSYPGDLPVARRVEEIKQAIAEHQVVVIAGETGSGKTTQIPKILLDMGRGIAGMIGHTQPRRLAARSVSSRIAEELGGEVGKEVGFQVRFSDHTSEQSYIKLMTDGILLAEIQRDPWLNKYDTIIIDEAHERSLNIDFLLGYLKRLLARRADLKLVITSATIDVDKFSRHFGDAPVIEVSGRTYPVEVLYRPPLETEGSDGDEADLADAVVAAVHEIRRLDRQHPVPYKDILVFLSGEKEIREVAACLRKEDLAHTEVLPLYARLSNKEQNRIFQSHSGRRIVLATNVAETSLTVPGIGYVIDSGLARISRYSVRSKIQRLPIEPISQASANQRAGRCGRLCPGTCIRLYSEEDFESRPAFTDTEITRTNLASVILQMLSLGLGDIEDFPFVDRPDSKAVSDGFKLLQELGAVDGDKRMTAAGRRMSKMPVDPKFARMILEAGQHGSLREVLIIVSALSIQDPRERPLDKQQAADEKHRRFRDRDSDFMAFVSLWDYYEEQRQVLSQNQLRKFCRDNFLSFLRMREWREVHRQLHLLCRELDLRENSEAAGYAQVHQALLGGLLGQIAWRLEDGTYLGARNRKFQIFPGSALYRRKTKWIVSAELVETTQLYARMNGRIEPQWVEALAGDLLKREYNEPHWEKRRGRVMAYEKVSLYGLVLVERRKVPFSPVDPHTSREIFIRQALVPLELGSKVDFIEHNRQLIEDVEAIEEKTRRRDILVDDETLYAFYDARLPEDVFDTRRLEKWYRKASRRDPDVLKLRREDLINPASGGYDLSQYPDRLATGSMDLKLDYRFNPGQAMDGISLDVPVTALRQLKEEDLDWLVPGMLREKCIALIKALPKQVRKNFVPVPDYVDRVMPRLKQGEGNLKLVLAQALKRETGVDVPLDLWDDYQLDEHLKMNINVLDEEGRVLGTGRDLAAMRERFAERVRESVGRHSRNSIERSGLTDWDFGELPEVHEVDHAGIKVKTWPALVDEGRSVALRLLDSPYRAVDSTRAGVVRLILLRLPQQVKYLRKQLLRDPRQLLPLRSLGSRDKLVEQIVRTACLAAFGLEDELPRDRDGFEAMLERGRGDLVSSAERVERLLCAIMHQHHEVQKALKSRTGLAEMAMQRDIGRQLDNLIYEDFLFDTPWEWLKEFPRYLKAIIERLEKYPRQAREDQRWTRELEGLWQRYQERRDYCRTHDIADPALDRYRWLLEEYRVSLFAQQLGTRVPVSAKRLEKLWLETGQGAA